MDREVGHVAVHEVTKSQTRLNNWTAIERLNNNKTQRIWPGSRMITESICKQKGRCILFWFVIKLFYNADFQQTPQSLHITSHHFQSPFSLFITHAFSQNGSSGKMQTGLLSPGFRPLSIFLGLDLLQVFSHNILIRLKRREKIAFVLVASINWKISLLHFTLNWHIKCHF